MRIVTSAQSPTDLCNRPLRMERMMRLTPPPAAALQSEADAIESVICVAISPDVPKVVATQTRQHEEVPAVPDPEDSQPCERNPEIETLCPKAPVRGAEKEAG